MKTKGVLYDVRQVMGGWNWRPDYSPALVHREPEIIKTGLHCTAVKICGRDIGRLALTAERALGLGLDAWFCPELWDRSPTPPSATSPRAAAAAEELRARWPGRMAFSVGTGATRTGSPAPVPEDHPGSTPHLHPPPPGNHRDLQATAAARARPAKTQ